MRNYEYKINTPLYLLFLEERFGIISHKKGMLLLLINYCLTKIKEDEVHDY